MQSTPMVVIPPMSRTFRKYCAQSEKTAASPNCKKITQPSGAATPRDSDAHHAYRCSEGSLRSSRAPPAKAQKRQSSPFSPLATQGFRNVRNAPRVEIAPPSETPRVSPCKRLCAILLRKPSVPAFTCENERRPFVREVEKHDEGWSEIELLLIVRGHRELGNICI